MSSMSGMSGMSGMSDMSVDELIDRLTHPDYVYYQNAIRNGDSSIVIRDGLLHFGKIKIQPPVIGNVFDDYMKFKNSLTKINTEIYILQERIVYSKTPKAYKDMYESKLIEMKNIESDMEMLKQYYTQVNSLTPSVSIEDLNNVLDKEAHSYEKLQEDIETYLNNTELKSYIKYFNKKYKLAQDIELEGQRPYINFYIKQLPKVVKLSPKKVDQDLEEEVEPNNNKKKLSPIQKDKIKSNIKELLAQKFKFKNMTECVSKAKTKPWFMSKEELIKTIEDNPEIKITMPKNYKSLKKEEICKFLT